MHPLHLVAKCTFVDEATFGTRGLGLCTRTGVQLTSHTQLNNQRCLVSSLMNYWLGSTWLDASLLKTTRPTPLVEFKGPVLGG